MRNAGFLLGGRHCHAGRYESAQDALSKEHEMVQVVRLCDSNPGMMPQERPLERCTRGPGMCLRPASQEGWEDLLTASLGWRRNEIRGVEPRELRYLGSPCRSPQTATLHTVHQGWGHIDHSESPPSWTGLKRPADTRGAALPLSETTRREGVHFRNMSGLSWGTADALLQAVRGAS